MADQVIANVKIKYAAKGFFLTQPVMIEFFSVFIVFHKNSGTINKGSITFKKNRPES